MSGEPIGSGDSSSGSVFNIFRGGDRYGPFHEEDEMIAHSPPSTHDFPEPIKINTKKTKLHKREGEIKSASNDISTLMPALEGRLKNIVVARPGQAGQEQFFPHNDTRRSSLTTSSTAAPDRAPAPFSALKLYERAKQMNPAGVEGMTKCASDTNLLQMVSNPLFPINTSSVVKRTSTAVEAAKADNVCTPKVIQQTTEEKMITNSSIDSTDGATNRRPLAAFSGWLLGGAKTCDVKDKDVNVFSPTSF